LPAEAGIRRTGEVEARETAPPPGAAIPVSLGHPAVASGVGDDLGLSGPDRRQLEQNGYRLEHRRGLMSVDVRNGRTVAVPVDAVEIRYVGHHVY
jgi:hypothetical protein